MVERTSQTIEELISYLENFHRKYYQSLVSKAEGRGLDKIVDITDIIKNEPLGEIAYKGEFINYGIAEDGIYNFWVEEKEDFKLVLQYMPRDFQKIKRGEPKCFLNLYAYCPIKLEGNYKILIDINEEKTNVNIEEIPNTINSKILENMLENVPVDSLIKNIGMRVYVFYQVKDEQKRDYIELVISPNDRKEYLSMNFDDLKEKFVRTSSFLRDYIMSAIQNSK